MRVGIYIVGQRVGVRGDPEPGILHMYQKKYVYMSYMYILYLVLFGVTQTQRWDPSPRFLGMRPGGGNQALLNAVMVWVTGILGG